MFGPFASIAEPNRHIALSRGGHFLATASRHTLRVHDLRAGGVVEVVVPDDEYPWEVAFAPGGEWLRLWSQRVDRYGAVAAGIVERRATASPGKVTWRREYAAVHALCGTRWIVSDPTIAVADERGARTVSKGKLRASGLASDGSMAAVQDGDAFVVVRCETGKQIGWQDASESYRAEGIAFTRDHVLVGGRGYISVMTLAGAWLHNLDLHSRSERSLLAGSTASLLAARDGVYDVSIGRRVAGASSEAHAAAFAEDLSAVAMSSKTTVWIARS